MTMRDLESYGVDPPSSQEAVPTFRLVDCRTALSPSKLPGLDFALNPYQGCAHDCVYCFAPAVLQANRSGWATDVGARTNMPKLLAKELRTKKGVIGLGTVTDPYQPLEARLRLTGRCLEEMVRAQARISLLTKSDLVVRDLDLLRSLPRVEVGITLTMMDERLSSLFEPGAPSPSSRLKALRQLSNSGIDTYAMIGPILPGVLEHDIHGLIEAIAASGAKRVMTDRLKLRPGLMQLFEERLSPERNGLMEFISSASDQARMCRIDDRIAAACSYHGLSYERAF